MMLIEGETAKQQIWWTSASRGHYVSNIVPLQIIGPEAVYVPGLATIVSTEYLPLQKLAGSL